MSTRMRRSNLATGLVLASDGFTGIRKACMPFCRWGVWQARVAGGQRVGAFGAVAKGSHPSGGGWDPISGWGMQDRRGRGELWGYNPVCKVTLVMDEKYRPSCWDEPGTHP